MAPPGPFVGVASPELCWSAHENELRVYSADHLEPHAGHGVAGLPERALFRFRFFSDSASEEHHQQQQQQRQQPQQHQQHQHEQHQHQQQQHPRGGRQGEEPPPLNPKITAPIPIPVRGRGGWRGFQKPNAAAAATTAAAAAATASSKFGTSPSSEGDVSMNSRFLPGRFSSREIGGTDGKGAGAAAAVAAAAAAVAVAGGSSSSSSVQVHPNVLRESRCARGGGGGAAFGAMHNAAEKLPVRAVEAVEMRDGRTLLLCLVSERGLDSEIHCVDPFSGETLHIATELPIMLTSLAIVPRLPHQRPGRSPGITAHCAITTGVPGDGGGGGVGGGSEGGTRGVARGVTCDEEEVVVAAVGGVGGRVRLVAIQIPVRQRSPAPPIGSVRRPAQWPREGGCVPSEREGVPISSLAAFLVPGGGCGSCVSMVAAGWVDGRWAVATCFDEDDGFGGGDGGGSRAGSLCGGGGGGGARTGSVGGGGGGGFSSMEACLSAVDVATGDTDGMGPALHIVHQDCARESPSPSPSPPTFRLWVSTARGFLCFEALAARVSSSPQVVDPIMAQRRTLVPAVRPQCLRAMAVGGGPSRPLMAFASVRTSDSSPILVILDAEPGLSWAPAIATAATTTSANANAIAKDYAQASANAGAIANANSNVTVIGTANAKAHADAMANAKANARAVAGAAATVAAVEEVELSTRCCSKNVVSANPHAVWVNPTEVKVFLSRPDGGVAAAADDDDASLNEEVWAGARSGLAMGSDNEAGRPQTDATLPSYRVHVRLSVIVAEASLSEAGRPRLRAWEHSHAGAAHRAAVTIERLGVLAFCDPSKAGFRADTVVRLTAAGIASLRHIVGGEGNLWARPPPSPLRGEGGVTSSRLSASASFALAPSLTPWVLLSARLQGAVALGRGPAVARALTARGAGGREGGEWMLPRALPVQEWAVAVALQAWEEARALLNQYPPPPASWPHPSSRSWREMAATLDAVARRARQVERILDASTERCRLNCEAAAATPTTTTTTTRGRRLTWAMTQRLVAEREAEAAPLRSRLRHASAAARLAFRVTSAASWLLTTGPPCSALSPSLLAGEAVAGLGVGVEVEARAPMDVVGAGRAVAGAGRSGGKRTGFVGAEQRAVGGCGSGAVGVGAGGGDGGAVLSVGRAEGSESSWPGPASMMGRLRERAGLEPTEPTVAAGAGGQEGWGEREGFGVGGGGGGGGVVDDPVALLVRISWLVGGVFDATAGDGDGDGTARGEEGGDGAVACLVLEEGLAAVAYSVMDSAFFLGREATVAAAAAAATAAASSGTVACCDGITREEEEEKEGAYAEEERALLERVERSFDRFCEKVGLPPALRLQARLSWLLDNRGTVRGAVSAAAAALLCPRAEAFLAEDPDLMGRAAAAIADGGWECGAGVRGEEGGCPSGRGWGAFAPLAEEMMGAAMRARGGETRAWDGEEDGMVLVGRDSGKRLRGASPRGGVQSPGRGVVQPGSARAGHGSGSHNRSGSVSGGDGDSVSGSGSNSRELTRKGWARRQERYTSTPPFSVGVKGGDGQGRQEEEGDREREFARWRTPTACRREPLPAGSRGDGNGGGEGEGGGSWEEEEGEEQQDEERPGSASSGKRPRARGRTLWQTPRGVGLTPRASGGSRDSPLSAGCRDVDGEEWGGRRRRGANAAVISAASPARRPRARGQTLWQTPRGVGLTPKVAGTQTREAQISVNYYDRGRYCDGVGGDQEGKQEDEHVGGASSVKRPRARGQTLWQTPKGVGLTPTRASARTGAMPQPPRYDGDGGGEFGAEEQQGEGHPGSASSVKRPRARGQTMWQTPRGVGLTPNMAGVRTGTLYSDHDGDGDDDGVGGRREEQQGEEKFGSSFSFERPRARGQTLWQTPRGVGLTPRRTGAWTGTSPLSVRYHDDDEEECGGEDQQEGEHPGTDSSVRRSRARGQTLWQTPRGVGLTPKSAGAQTEEPLSVRYRGDGGDECGVEQQREQDHPSSALSAERPRARGQTLWQTPRSVGLTPKMADTKSGVLFSGHTSDGGNEDGVGARREQQQGEVGSSIAFSFERPRSRGQTLWQTPRGVGLTPKVADARTRTPLADRYHDNDGDGGGEYGEEEQQQEEHPGDVSSVRRPRARGQTVWQTPRGVGLTPKTAGAWRGSPPSVNSWDADDNDDGVEGAPLGQQDEGYPGNASSSVARPRARGQTVWQTPRGVGLTPKKRGGDVHTGCAFSTATDHIDGDGGGGEASGEQDLGGLDQSGAAPPGQAPRGRGLFPSTPRRC